MGKIMGIVSTITNAGAYAGPMAGGFLLDVAGYWATWSVAIGLVSSLHSFLKFADDFALNGNH